MALKNKMTGFKVYNGTKSEFISKNLATTYADAIVFIKGGNDASQSCIFAQGMYFANFTEFIAAYVSALNYVKGIVVGDTTYNAAAGGGYVGFGASDPATLEVDVQNGKVTVGLSDAFVAKVASVGTAADEASATGSAFARIAKLAKDLSDLTGSAEGSIADQIADQIAALKAAIEGDLSKDATDAKTLEAINDELNAIDLKIQGITGDYLKAADKTELANRITNEAPVTMTEAAGSGDVLKTYTFTQNGKPIGTINLAKELVVTNGAIVEIDGVKNLQLTIANQTAPVNIPVTDLVDVYTAKANAAQVQVAISNTNEISASVVKGSIAANELAANAVVTAKIADGNVTKAKLETTVQASLNKADSAYQKPSTGIPASDFAQAVKDSLGKADAAAPQATTYSKVEVDAMWMWEEL